MSIRVGSVLALIFCAVEGGAAVQQAAADDAKDPLTLGAFVDTYYAYDDNQHGERKRPYTTQAWYNEEGNLNLAYLEGKADYEDLRGRLAFQAGSSVESNYAAEPEEFWRFVQEATAGVRVTENLWLDGGIYLSHLGLESWISSNNWNYTRSLIAEFSPYYQVGASATYSFDDATTLSLHLINGWQNISDDRNPAFGAKLAHTFNDSFSASYSNYLSNEKDLGTRFFNDFVATGKVGEKLELAGAFDIGFQELTEGNGDAMWNGFAGIARYEIDEKVHVAARIERFFDPSGVVLASLSENSFTAWGTSVNIDYAPHEIFLIRGEFRFLFDDDPVFPEEDSFNTTERLFVISIAAKL